MTPFLQEVAARYSDRYGCLSRFCFVFPNKRSGTFFLKYLRSHQSKAQLMLPPKITTFSALAEEVSGLVLDNRVDMLLTLYNEYIRRVKFSQDDPRLKFEAFRGWGEMVLQDFDDIDRYGADPEEVLKNVTDLKQLESYSLTEEQLQVLKDFFGMDPDTSYPEQFWKKTLVEKGAKSEIRNLFLRLWEILLPLYHGFNESLESRGLASQGRMYSRMQERLEEGAGLGYDKLVFVGFYDISRREKAIFELLRSRHTSLLGETEPLADFVWDFMGKVALDSDNVELRFLRDNIRKFPHPEWLRLTDCATEGIPVEMHSYAVPSNAMQAKLAGEILEGIDHSQLANAEAAVVLPDESLLLPLLHSLPDDVGSMLNLTMGYPMRLTGVMSFIGIWRRLLKNRRVKGGVANYLHSDLDTLLAHPLTAKWLGKETTAGLRKRLASQSFRLSWDDLREDDEESLPLRLLLQGGRGEPFAYVLEVLQSLSDAMNAEGEDPSMRLDASHVETVLQTARQLRNSFARHKVATESADTVLQYTESMLRGQHVTFEGEPLNGLQIVGLLETRCVDFKHLFILSMNENVLPRKQQNRSFIPLNLRYAYGLPTPRQREWASTYLFYRMISRASKVHFIYDSRVPDFHHGELSRYLLQLRHLYAPGQVQEREYQFSITTRQQQREEQPKDQYVMASLQTFFADYEEPEATEGQLAWGVRRKNLSASSLKSYVKCPMAFYFSAVAGIADDPEPSEFMTAAERGNVIHAVMSEIMLKGQEEGKLLQQPSRITADYLSEFIQNPGPDNPLERLLAKHINLEYGRPAEQELMGDEEIFRDMMAQMARKLLVIDRNLKDLEILGCEVKGVLEYPLGDRKVRMKYVIDRLDRYTGEDGLRHLRIVDYKSGKIHLFANRGVEGAFETEEKSSGDHALQLFLYALLLGMKYPELQADELVIYSLVDNKLETGHSDDSNGAADIVISSQTGEIRNWDADYFRQRLDDHLTTLFNPSVPFLQCDDCSSLFCNFKPLCRR